MMKKLLFGLLLFIAVLLAAMLILPMMLKDKIQEKVVSEISTKIKGQLYLDTEATSLSFFRNFPDLTLQLGNFGIINAEPFLGDTLVHASSFELSLDVMSVLKGDQIVVKKIALDKPIINVEILPDGRANYDIAISDTTAVEEKPTDEKPSEFNVAIKSWAITDAVINYLDAQTPGVAQLVGFTHTGKGDFTQQVFDIETDTKVNSVSVEWDSTTYFRQHTMSAILKLNIDKANKKYTFRENEFKINDFTLNLDGWVALPDGRKEYDLKFNSPATGFGSLISIIPSVFKQGMANLKTDGTLAFNGSVKGVHTPEQLPALKLQLLVENGMLQYPNLPSAITKVGADFNIDFPGGELEKLKTELKSFHMEIGRNPVDMSFQTEGIKRINLKGKANAKMDLADVTAAFPIEGTTLKGLFSLNADAEGLYDPENKKLPTVNASMQLLDGYVKSAKVPAPLEKLGFEASVSVPNGMMEAGKVKVSNFGMVLEGEQVNASATLENFVDYAYDLQVKGKIDLDKMTKIYPIEGMTLAGKMIADISTKGKMSDVEAKRFEKLPTSGSFMLENFSYKTATKPEVKIARGTMLFDPKAMRITQMEGALGKSPFSLTGDVSNYIGYVFGTGTLVGQMSIRSPKFDANEWTSSKESSAAASGGNAPANTNPAPPAADEEAVSVPKNLDLRMEADMGELLYSKYQLKDFKGVILVKNGIATMDKLRFQTMEGTVLMSGTYDPKDLKNPAFNFNLNVSDLSIPEAFRTVDLVKKAVPAAEKMTGKFGTTLSMRGNLLPDMSPNMNSILANAQMLLGNAGIRNVEVTKGINGLAKTSLPTEFQLGNTSIKATIENGRVRFQPFDINAGGQKLTLSGSQGFDGSIDYMVRTPVPANQLSGAAAQALGSVLGSSVAGIQTLLVDVGVGGTYSKPSYRLIGVSAGGSGGKASSVTDLAKEAADKARAEAEARARAEADRLKREAEDRARTEAERLKREAEEKAKNELNKLKDRFKLPGR